MVVGIDATNIRFGGGLTHLTELLGAAQPELYGIESVVIWGGVKTLEKVPSRPWLVKKHRPVLDRSLLFRIGWQRFSLSRAAAAAKCDVLFVPGGSFSGKFRPIVVMSQNLLPFEWKEMRRYGVSVRLLKLWLLRITQSAAFRRARGVIHLTEYAERAVRSVIGATAGQSAIVPHGLDGRFVAPVRPQLPISAYSTGRPFRILYVSMIDVYKHQDAVAKAVASLRIKNLPVTVEFVGPAYPAALRKLKRTLKQIDPRSEFSCYSGNVPHERIHQKYQAADLGIFASSCETFGQIMLETMGAGLPLVCSDRAAMPEILRDGGEYFDPEKPAEIAAAIERYLHSPDLRARRAERAAELARAYNWNRCAAETFQFLAEAAASPISATRA